MAEYAENGRLYRGVPHKPDVISQLICGLKANLLTIRYFAHYLASMKPIEIVTGLLAITSLLAVVARRLNLSYPILLVLVGLVIGWVPALPDVELEPDVAFLVFLPPLLYSAAWSINNADLKRYRRSVGLLAIGLVLFTSTLVAFVTSALIPGFSLAQGFLLGAIIAPPDAVAASSVMRGLGVPKRINTVLEGESLVNDATSLVLYRFALGAILTGQFSLAEASWRFVWSGVASVGLGLAFGWLMQFVHLALRRDPVTNTAVTLLIPYSVYLVAEHVDLSGVLAVVAAGLFLSWRDNRIFSNQSRLQAYNVWDVTVFLLNGLVFILIGLQLPQILRGLNTVGLPQAIGYAGVLAAVVIGGRLLWVYPGAYGPRLLSRHIRQTEPRPKWQEVTVVAWAGMRGVVSLAAALALPNTLPNGQPFPGRDLILFLTFCIILCTLVVQGLSLPLLVRWLNVHTDNDENQQERDLRRQLAQRAITHLEENHSAGSLPDPVLAQLKNAFELKIDHLLGRVRTDLPGQAGNGLYERMVQVQLELIDVERDLVNKLRREGDYSDEVLRKLEQELDLEAVRLTSSMPTATIQPAETVPVLVKPVRF